MIHFDPRKVVKNSLLAALAIVALAAGCGRHDHSHGRQKSGPIRLGYVGGPHASVLYVAEQQAVHDARAPAFIAVSYNSSAEIGYALMAGNIDAGFIETSRAMALFRSVNGLAAIGAVTYPYGATLVVRKDLDIRLDDLAGHTVAVAGRRCRLLHQFLADTERLGVDPASITFVPLPFDQMIPALEARRVDAMLTRGGHALLAAAQDHQILYQNWDVTGDDECCPQTLAQIEQVLVTRAKGAGARRIRELVAALEAANAAPPDDHRASVAARTRIPLDILGPFPVASFTALTPEQQAELGSDEYVEDKQ